jgi:serine/threonine protein kinase
MILYEMLTGGLPFEGESYNDLLIKVLTEAPRPPREVNPAFPAEAGLTVMRALARRTAALAPADLETLPLFDRIEVVATFLTEQGFMAGVEKNGNDLFLHTCNCPYAKLADAHPELCHMDLQLINDLTGLKPQRIAHIANGDGRCTYRLEMRAALPVQDAPLITSVPVGEMAHA